MDSEKINELNHPYGTKIDLEAMLFTLHIAARALPTDSDPIHLARIDWITVELGYILL